MKSKFVYVVSALFSILLITGCSKTPISESADETDHNKDVKAAAWEFIHEKGWQKAAKEDWQDAKVEEVIADHKYILVDKTYDGVEVLSVSFEDVDDAVTGTPVVLVDPKTNEVIGYMPSE